eukprot:1714474-Alexandrium_andersonii.AAC.1
MELVGSLGRLAVKTPRRARLAGSQLTVPSAAVGLMHYRAVSRPTRARSVESGRFVAGTFSFGAQPAGWSLASSSTVLLCRPLNGSVAYLAPRIRTTVQRSSSS